MQEVELFMRTVFDNFSITIFLWFIYWLHYGHVEKTNSWSKFSGASIALPFMFLGIGNQSMLAVAQFATSLYAVGSCPKVNDIKKTHKYLYFSATMLAVSWFLLWQYMCHHQIENVCKISGGLTIFHSTVLAVQYLLRKNSAPIKI